MPAQRRKAGESDAVEARHDTGTAGLDHDIMPAAHLVDLAGEVKGEHDFPPMPLGRRVDDAHYGRDALLERTEGAVRLQFVVLDEVNAAIDQTADRLRRCLGRQADRGLDNGADERQALDHPPAAACRKRQKPGPDRRRGRRSAASHRGA